MPTFFFYVAVPPRITGHPQDIKDAIPGKSLALVVEATGTQPLNYQWEWKSALDDGEWQSCDVERFPGADSSTIVICSVDKSNEGSYHCVVTNCAGTHISNSAKLSVGKKNSIYIQYELLGDTYLYMYM